MSTSESMKIYFEKVVLYEDISDVYYKLWVHVGPIKIDHNLDLSRTTLAKVEDFVRNLNSISKHENEYSLRLTNRWHNGVVLSIPSNDNLVICGESESEGVQTRLTMPKKLAVSAFENLVSMMK